MNWSDGFGLNGRRSWWESLGANIYLSDVDLQAQFKQLLHEGGISYHWLPALLHEATHHWCYDSPLGAAIAGLHMRARKTGFVNFRSIKRLDSHTARDFLRARAAELILAPLAEGLALFMEFDAFPGTAPRMSTPLLLTLLFFTGKEEFQRECQSASENELPEVVNKALRKILIRVRTWDVVVKRKINLFSQPLNCRDGGYLPGYLTVKLMHRWAISHCDALQDSDFFVLFVRQFFFTIPI